MGEHRLCLGLNVNNRMYLQVIREQCGNGFNSVADHQPRSQGRAVQVNPSLFVIFFFLQVEKKTLFLINFH